VSEHQHVVITADEGTSYCIVCELEARLREAEYDRNKYLLRADDLEARVAELEQELREARRKAMPRYGMKLEQEVERLREENDRLMRSMVQPHTHSLGN
jgi:hypothetical protein